MYHPHVRRLLLLLTPLACNRAGPVDTSGDVDLGASSSDESGPDPNTTDADTTGEPGTDTSDADTSTGDADTHDTDVSPVEFTCTPGEAPSDPFIDCVESFIPEGATYGQDDFPTVVFGPPVAAATGMGSTDVLSLGCGGEITLRFDEPAIVDGPGPDFIVFENPLPVGDMTFAEPARVLVSEDGLTWHAFPCDPADAKPPLGCAGVAQVLAGPDNQVDPTDPDVAGGDAFDLADLGLTQAHYVRLIDVGVAYYGSRMWCGGGGGGFDLDAIAVVHGNTP
jgi:hypothetical protein